MNKVVVVWPLAGNSRGSWSEAGSVSRSALREDDFRHFRSLAFARMPRVEGRGGMARDDRDVARRATSGGFGVVPLDFATDAQRGSAGSFSLGILGTPDRQAFRQARELSCRNLQIG
jgi:hypothetical protein